MENFNEIETGKNNKNHERKNENLEEYIQFGVKTALALFGALLVSAAAIEMKSCEKSPHANSALIDKNK